jgi:hypothetical protein
VGISIAVALDLVQHTVGNLIRTIMKVSRQALDVYISPTINIDQLLDLSSECTARNDQFSRRLAHWLTLLTFC